MASQNEANEAKVKQQWWSELPGQLLMGLFQIFFGIVLTGMVLYLAAQYKTGTIQPFELATVAGLLGGFPLVAAIGRDSEFKQTLLWIGGLYIFSAIFFVVFGFYQAADQAKLLPTTGSTVWMFTVIFVTTFYTAAIALIIGMWKTLLFIPKMVGLGSILDNIFRRNRAKVSK